MTSQHYFPDIISDLPEDEVWIDGFVGWYSIRPDGKVFSYHNGRKELKHIVSKTRNRVYVNLVVKNDIFRHDVHILVANAFLSNPGGYKQIVFKDGNPANCALDNLAWKSEYRLDVLPEGCEWIDGYAGLYYLTGDGNVYNKYNVLQSGTDRGKYMHYCLTKDGIQSNLLINKA